VRGIKKTGFTAENGFLLACILYIDFIVFDTINRKKQSYQGYS